MLARTGGCRIRPDALSFHFPFYTYTGLNPSEFRRRRVGAVVFLGLRVAASRADGAQSSSFVGVRIGAARAGGHHWLKHRAAGGHHGPGALPRSDPGEGPGTREA